MSRPLVPCLIAALAAAPALPMRAAQAEPSAAMPPPPSTAHLPAPPPVLRPPEHGLPDTAPQQPPAPGGSAGTTQALLPSAPLSPLPDRSLVLDRSRRRLTVLENGREVRNFPVAVGMPGWETPVGRFQVIEKTANPTWEHPANGRFFPPGPDNPLGSRWVGFYRDCGGRKGFNGKEHLEVKGCVTAGFHGTPDRGSVGRAVSHGCVRLFDEDARELFDLVRVGTPVTVLP